MIKILCPDPKSFSNAGLNFAHQYSELVAKKLSQKEFYRCSGEYDALLIRFNNKIGEEFFGNSSKVKAIISPTTGLDHIDLDAARSHNVKVFHLRGQKRFLKGISGTAELTIGLMLALVRKIPQSFESVKDERWDPGPYRGNEISGKVMGVIGCGRLGSKVARTAVALGMKVLAYDPFLNRFPSKVSKINELSELLRKSDVITLHVPLVSETRHLIGLKEVHQMKDGVFIINTSRGAILSSKALLLGLKSEKIKAAALDVLENEHSILTSSHELIDYANNYDNLLITPHIGGATYESVEKTDLFILKKFFKSIKE